MSLASPNKANFLEKVIAWKVMSCNLYLIDCENNLKNSPDTTTKPIKIFLTRIPHLS